MAEVKFYSIPQHQYENSCYVIGGTTESNLTHTATGVKIKEYDNIRFKCPNHEGIHRANVCTIDGWVHDILEVEVNTLDSPSCEVLVSFNPVSNLPPGARMFGYFVRGPSRVDAYGSPVYVDRLPVEYDTTMEYKDFIPFVDPELSQMTSPDLGSIPLYVQVVTTKRRAEGNWVDDLTIYGTYAALYDHYPIYVTGHYIDYRGPDPDETGEYWAGLFQAMKGFGAAPSSILGVHVSTRSPWSIAADGDRLGLTLPGSGIFTEAAPYWDNGKYRIIQMGGEAIAPLGITRPDLTYEYFVDPVVRYYGKLSIIDELGNELAHIPNNLIHENDTLTIRTNTKTDFTGITTLVTVDVPHQYGVRSHPITLIQEGSWPFLGDSWTEYQRTNMGHDRQALEHAINMADEQFKLDVMEGGANALLTAGIGGSPASAIAAGAQFGVSALSGSKRMEMTRDDLRFQQRLTEGRIKSSTTQYYNTGYGGSYVQQRFRNKPSTNPDYLAPWNGGAGLKIEIPSGMNAYYMNKYLEIRGWPINRHMTYNPIPGYYQGNLESLENTDFAGMRLRRLSEWLAKGFRIVIV